MQFNSFFCFSLLPKEKKKSWLTALHPSFCNIYPQSVSCFDASKRTQARLQCSDPLQTSSNTLAKGARCKDQLSGSLLYVWPLFLGSCYVLFSVPLPGNLHIYFYIVADFLSLRLTQVHWNSYDFLFLKTAE
jgi:hypothetical protein